MVASNLSHRGALASDSSASENQVWDVCASLWDPTANPDGYVSLGVAENALMHKELANFFNSQQLVDQKSFTYGDGPSGSKPARNAIAKFMNTYFKSLKSLDANQIVVTNGLSSVLEHASWALTNPGDGILLGRPYYRSFISDLTLRTGARIVPVAFQSTDPFSREAVGLYEKALLLSQNSGVKVKALLLCHPHNPLGRCYPEETIVELMELCQKYQIHLISDEIYAMSVWGQHVTDPSLDTDTVPFESVLSIDTDDIIDPSLVHVLWGLSKDFGANGLRLGALISQSNPNFLAAVRTCGIYSSPSSLAETATVRMLTDNAFVETYIKDSQKLLAESYMFAVNLLRKYDIEFKPGASAAFFLWANLGRTYLEKHPEAKEKAKRQGITEVVFQELMGRKVFVVSGDAAGAEEPGWYRLVFSEPRDIVEEGIKRIAEALT
ncbi:pyridoxal phosphate-dependent transferase [Lophiotrema nucula]|uniref:Pyridoxal phosphate-dependent transferase n=1 Tax=Lophiotrema nucula TaxID=690887 RepID=A0A6A5Z0T8_9PLEO|nr:pyridoxal phosphate-dependent transferase [Lophiotrema nucula]